MGLTQTLCARMREADFAGLGDACIAKVREAIIDGVVAALEKVKTLLGMTA